MSLWMLLVLVIYGLLLLFIFMYSLIQFDLFRIYKKFSSHHVRTKLEHFPKVCVQLPVYNEKYVVNDLIDCCMRLDYPIECFEVQVLDDSTDTTELISVKVREWRAKGFQIRHIRRDQREGFKAGALSNANRLTNADFLPNPDFLRKTLLQFTDDQIGMVQTQWRHLNRSNSLLTELQAFALDAHFSIEQKARNVAGHFMNFNGTAGIWRKSCIEDAGGWESDTLTEDLDLSYRAQMKGWKFIFLEEEGVPAELPAHMPSLKSQQFRWTKGAAECARKNLSSLWREDFPFWTKVHGSFHLLNSTVFLAVLGAALLSVPILQIKIDRPQWTSLFILGGLFVLSLGILALFYWNSFKSRSDGKVGKPGSFLWRFPAFLSVSMGMSLHNSIAVGQGLLGIKTPFIRTPKFRLMDDNGSIKSSYYLGRSIPWLSLLELSLFLYFSFGLYLGIQAEEYGMIPYHALLSLGFGIVAFYDIKYSRLKSI